MAVSKFKILWVSFGVLVTILALLGVVVVFYLGNVVKTTVETLGPRLTGTPVTLEQATVRPLHGKASLMGLVVGNPPGYAAPHAIRSGEFTVDLAPRSILTDRILVHSIEINGPEITLEGSLKHNNLTVIKDHVQAMTPAGKPTPDAPGSPSGSKPVPPKYVEIENLVIRNGVLHFSTLLAVPLPEITLTDIGKNQDLTIADTIAFVLDQMVSAALGAFGNTPNLLGNTLKDLRSKLRRKETKPEP